LIVSPVLFTNLLKYVQDVGRAVVAVFAVVEIELDVM